MGSVTTNWLPSSLPALLATNVAAMRFDQFAHQREPDAQDDSVEAVGVCALHERLEKIGQGPG